MASGSRKRLIIGNWKTYIEAPEDAKRFAQTLRRKAATFSGVQVVLAPSFPLLPLLTLALKGSSLQVGAQDLSAHPGGAHTGEVPGALLKALGVSFVIVGHSERRAAGERDQEVHEKFTRALDEGIRPVLCIGEKERDASGDHFEYLGTQLSSALAGIAKADAGKFVIAYEPVWAIGKTASGAMKPTELRETAIFIRKSVANRIGRDAALRVPILYGGSVEPSNAATLIQEGNVSGFLVGHASADANSFLQILQSVR
ncbi:MAG: triose-phosphate isomerase [Patescibacteria group bacterium]|nr:triose-phosphate isomerase [Patescibacteria group bacterium]